MSCENASTIRDLPIPASPESRTTSPSPWTACTQRSFSRATSCSRPTKLVIVDEAGGETARRLVFFKDPPDRDRPTRSLELGELNASQLENIADEPARLVGYQDIVRTRLGLDMRRQIRRFPDHRFFLGQRTHSGLADHDKARGDSDPNPQLRLAPAADAPDRPKNSERRMDRPLRAVFVRARIAEQRHDAIADIVRDQAIELLDRAGTAVVITPRDLVQFFRIERLCELGRTDKIAEQHRQMTAFASGSAIVGARRRRDVAVRAERPCTSREALAASPAIPAVHGVYLAAGRTMDRQFDAALRAEARGGRIVRLATGAFHETPLTDCFAKR